MIQYLVIAARNHPDLYSYLRRQFTGDHTVQVLLDRRYDERRRVGDARKPDRRRGDRRGGRAKENGLNYHGFVVIRQSLGVQWRPPWWGRAIPEAPSALEKATGADEATGSDARNVVTGWFTEGQRLLSVVPRLVHEHAHLTARAEAAERKYQRCEEEIRSLRSENEHFRRERRQAVETLKALTKQLIDSAAETPSAKS
jgi:hypothetical protein